MRYLDDATQQDGTILPMKHPPRNIVIDWLNTIWSTDLPPNAKLIACNLRRYMTGGKEMAYPGVRKIAGECGITDRTVQKMLKLLTEEGWLINNGQSHLMTTIYACSLPPEIDSPPKLMTQPPEMISDNKVINKVNTLSKGSRFVRPTIDDIKIYCAEKGYTFDPETFINHYNSNGWKVGRNSMKCWKSACATWNKREKTNGSNRKTGRSNSQGPEVISAADLLNESNVIS